MANGTADFGSVEGFVREALAAQGFMRLVGAEVEEVVPGRCTLAVDFRPDLTQQNGFFHGGVVAFLFDNTTAAAAATAIKDPKTEAVLSAEYKLNILSPARGPRLRCRAEVVKPGRTLIVVDARVYDMDREGREKPVAIGLATIARVALERVS
ncbi:MAG TPA: PaaI family thioesterase [Stellaceae bacterium]|jgi:uncharacterized protein (TIGR00369 family)